MIFATAKSIKIPKTMPKTQLTKVTINSSVMKYPATRLFGQPAALINPKSLVLCAIIKKTMKEVSTAPIIKISMTINKLNWLKIAVRPNVNLPAVDAIPNPKRLLNNKINRVEATLNVKVAIVRLVCSFLLSKSLIGKPALLILTDQFSLI